MTAKERLEIGHAGNRKDVPRFSRIMTEADGWSSTEVSVGSYQGSQCLSIDVWIRRYFENSNRLIEKYGAVAIPYSDMDALHLLKEAVDGAIRDAKKHNREQARKLAAQNLTDHMAALGNAALDAMDHMEE